MGVCVSKSPKNKKANEGGTKPKPDSNDSPESKENVSEKKACEKDEESKENSQHPSNKYDIGSIQTVENEKSKRILDSESNHRAEVIKNLENENNNNNENTNKIINNKYPNSKNEIKNNENISNTNNKKHRKESNSKVDSEKKKNKNKNKKGNIVQENENLRYNDDSDDDNNYNHDNFNNYNDTNNNENINDNLSFNNNENFPKETEPEKIVKLEEIYQVPEYMSNLFSFENKSISDGDNDNNKNSYIHYKSDTSKSVNFKYLKNLYSTDNDFNKILSIQTYDRLTISKLLLCLNERKWLEERINLSNNFISKREKMDSYIINIYLKSIISQHNHFNWIIYSLSLLYNNALYENTTSLNNTITNSVFNDNFYSKSQLPKPDSSIWLKGFEWKGLYIKVQSYEESKELIKEIKGLNYLFFDYIQVLDNCKLNNINKKDKKFTYLSNEIVFPFINYCYINGMILYATCLIDKNTDENKDDKIDYNTEDIDESRLLSYLSKNNLIRLLNKNNNTQGNKDQKYKYLIHNSYSLIPNLFEIELKNSFKDIEKFNYFYYDKDTKIFETAIKNKNYSNQKCKDFFNGLLLKVFNNNNIDFSKLKSLNVSKNGIDFKIIYDENNNLKNYDNNNNNLINFLINNYQYQNEKLSSFFSSSSKEIKINSPVLVLYRLNELTKIKYSLIRKIFNNNKKDVFRKNFHLQSNYFNYFNMWCQMHCANNYDINTIDALKENMHKYGINMSLSVFALVNILNYNENLSDLIKIYILISLIHNILDYNEGINLQYKLTLKEEENKFNVVNYFNIDFDFNDSPCNTLSDLRKYKIYYVILSILYPHTFKNNKFLNYFMEQLLLSLNIKSLKWRLIDDYMGMGFFANDNTQNYFEPKRFLKELIFTSRKKPFLFISSLENKLNFKVNPHIKFLSSLSIESMYNKLKFGDINILLPNLISYINPREISGYMLAKSINSINKMQMIYDDNNNNNKNDDMGLKPSSIWPKAFFMNQEKAENELKDKAPENININNITKISDRKISESFIKGAGDENLKYTTINAVNNNNLTLEYPKDSKKKNKNKNSKNEKITWQDISEDFSINLPSLIYKQKYKYEEYSSKVNAQLIYTNLTNNYQISKYDIIQNWVNVVDEIFKNIITPNFTCELEIVKAYAYDFLNSFYVDKHIENSKYILNKIKEIFNKKNIILINFEILALVELYEGLLENNYIKSEEYYSKSLILSLFSYGDARGRYNDGHGFIMYPLWKVARKCNFLDHVIVENFKELFHSQTYFYKLGRHTKNVAKNFQYKPVIDYSYNQQMNLENIYPIVNESLNETYNNKLTESVNFLYEDIDERPTDNYIINNIERYSKLTDGNFNADLCDVNVCKPFSFPQISDRDKNYITAFESKEFIIFMFKQINIYLNVQNYNISNDNLSNFNILDLFFMNNITQSDNSAFNTNNDDVNSVSTVNPIKKKNRGQILSHYVYNELLKSLSYKEHIPNRTLISFGNNKHCETSHEECETLSLPRIAYKLKNINVSKISCGWDHNVIIDDEGDLYAWGHNQSSQCGISNHNGKDNLNIKSIVNLSKLNNLNVKFKQTACGNEHTLCLTTEGEIYGFGMNCDGVLGKKDSSFQSEKFQKIDFFQSANKKPIKIKYICCGTVHNLALSEDGKVYSWGSAQGGQLGLDENYLTQLPDFDKNLFVENPSLVLETGNIVKISAGEAHSIALTNSGRCYSWGFGSNGQLGLGFCEDSFEPGSGMVKSRILEPKLVHKLTANVSDVVCGKTFTMFITENRELYACGVNDLHQLGVSEPPSLDHLFRKDLQCFDFVYPTKIEHFLNMKVQKVSCGEGHCLAIIKDTNTNISSVWSWGNNKYGQLGLGAQIKTSLPKPIGWLFGTNEFFKVDKIACGGFHSICLLKSNINLDWIEDDLYKIIIPIIDSSSIN